MKLYEVPRNTWIKVKKENSTPPGAYNIGINDVIFFNHIDGMYSHCVDKNNSVVHLAAYAEVEIIKEPKNIT